MRGRELAVSIDSSRAQPLFVQLAGAVTEGIRSGRLKRGEALPGSRELARQLGVNRNTVMAAYRELLAEGQVSTRVGGGTFVAETMPPWPRHLATRMHGDAPTYAFTTAPFETIANAAPPPGTLLLHSAPDPRLFPAREFTRAFRRAIGPRVRLLAAGAGPCGHMRLREQLAAMLAHLRGLPVTADNVMITRSIEQAIDLVARLLLAPGDVVAVEAMGYPPAWNVLRLTGARLVPLPIDGEGLDIDALETLVARERIRAVFLTPHHQFPTTVVMSAARRARIAALALRHRFAIIEDDYDHEFHYASRPVLPIAAGTGGANVIYIGSLANLTGPGASTAFITAPAPVFARLAALRAASDARGDAAMECAIAELFEDGELLRHLRRVRRVYRTRRDALAEALKRHLREAVEFRVAEGGLALWAQVDEAIDPVAWAHACAGAGVRFADTRLYDFAQRSVPFLRLGFSYLDEREIDEAVRRMARALRTIKPVRLAA